MNSENELIYIDNANNIKKMSSDTKTTTTFGEATHPQWRKTCVFWSKTTEDLLVGMDIYGKKKAKTIQQGKQEHDDFLCSKVIRYNKPGKEIQTIQFNKRQQLFKQPLYITENNNRDVVVSDNKNSVVVTEIVEENIVLIILGTHQGQDYHHVGFVLTPSHTSWWLTLTLKLCI